MLQPLGRGVERICSDYLVKHAVDSSGAEMYAFLNK